MNTTKPLEKTLVEKILEGCAKKEPRLFDLFGVICIAFGVNQFGAGVIWTFVGIAFILIGSPLVIVGQELLTERGRLIGAKPTMPSEVIHEYLLTHLTATDHMKKKMLRWLWVFIFGVALLVGIILGSLAMSTVGIIVITNTKYMTFSLIG